ncbi:MAG: CRISPR-associated helicase Cas3' [Salinivirgaceae bacterium]|nr:CRISPR-associated helicase Cas3' [Salinivirgaceae bacterium]
MGKYLAHSKNENDEVHYLTEHLKEASLKMQEFSNKKEFKEFFSLTGMMHDFGKYQMAFQKYLTNGGKRGSVPHASWGAALALQYKQYEAAFAIDGHHKGLPDKADLKDDCADFLGKEHSMFNEMKKVFLNEMQIQEKDLDNIQLQINATERELFIRYLFSALTDADWLDTEKHFNINNATQRESKIFDANILIDKLDKDLAGKSKEGYINELRNKVRDYAVAQSQYPAGFYSMTLPTGIGKTLASMSWALQHASKNNLKRVIIVLPFISIIDQTAKELKRIFGDEWVLEHHSNYNEDEATNHDIASENPISETTTKRLATENWDYPIIVTTTVQFFESLFSNKPSRCRKVHSIAESVVIFDEVQTLPKELVLPTLSMLRDVNKIMQVSFLFCTATQPAFEKSEKFNGIENIISLVENPKEVFEATKRVQYFPVNQYQPIDIVDLAEQVLHKGVSTLTIFNTKKQALLFYNEISKSVDYRLFHLSTNMYPAHRKRVIGEIRDCLKRKDKILVASTQLIEAGVDFDFPCVFREIAPLESIIQSAGRCNREGVMVKLGEVYIFSLEDKPRPMKQYYSLADFANTMYNGKEEILFEHDFFGEYYRKAFQLFIPEDKFQIKHNRENFNFKKVAEAYRIIDSATTPLFVLCEESRELYESIRYKPILSRADYRAMQQFSVQVYDHFMKNHFEKIGQESQGYWIWHGEYSKEHGISTENTTLIV